MSKIKLGFIGAGPVTQAIHLPVLATMSERFEVTCVMDINPDVADEVASRCNAIATTEAAIVIDDPDIDVVAICSPNAFHAQQVIDACLAGKKVVLCEKPLAVTRDEADQIASFAAKTGTVIIVGTMHAYDPAYRAARTAWEMLGEEASFIQSSIYLPSNATFEDQATEKVAVPPGPARAADAKSMMRAAMLGLAIHNIPLVRDFYPRAGEVLNAKFLPPFGYALATTNGEQMAEFHALMPGEWPPNWSLKITGREHELSITFPPSYVLAGSAQAELKGMRSSQSFQMPLSGYEALWLHIAEVIEQGTQPIFAMDRLVADLGFALDLADGADRVLERS